MADVFLLGRGRLARERLAEMATSLAETEPTLILVAPLTDFSKELAIGEAGRRGSGGRAVEQESGRAVVGRPREARISPCDREGDVLAERIPGNPLQQRSGERR